MKLVKSAAKAYSTWSGLSLVVVMAVSESMPVVEEQMPSDLYTWVVFSLAVATPILRFIDQGLEK